MSEKNRLYRHCKLLTLEELEAIVQYHAHRYYCLDNPCIEDWEYDVYEDVLRETYAKWDISGRITDRVGQGKCKELHK